MNINHYIEQQSSAIFTTYKELHCLAEPSGEEKKTSQYIIEKLKNIPTKTYSNHYGIIAEIQGETQEVVALRADMDALTQEVDNVVKANHSCGHDAHSTMVLHTALSLLEQNIRPKRTIRFLFQPAEEIGIGAKLMMESNALEQVTFLLGLHLRPQFEVPFGQASPVIIHGSTVTITGTITGLQAHAARPNLGINAIEATSLLVQQLKEIRLSTDISHSIKMTQLQTDGNASNIIPSTVTFALDVRAQTNEVMNELLKITEQIITYVSSISRTTITFKQTAFIPAAITNAKAIQLVQSAIEQVLGTENTLTEIISPGGEDFHFYSLKHPEISATMVGLGCGLTPGLHHPQMTFSQEALIYGTQILTTAILMAANE